MKKVPGASCSLRERTHTQKSGQTRKGERNFLAVLAFAPGYPRWRYGRRDLRQHNGRGGEGAEGVPTNACTPRLAAELAMPRPPSLGKVWALGPSLAIRSHHHFSIGRRTPRGHRSPRGGRHTSSMP